MLGWRWNARPPRWARVMAGAFTVLPLISLAGADGPLDVLELVLLSGLMITAAIAPRGLYDGRFAMWSRAHPKLAGGAISLAMGLLALGIFRDFLDLQLSLLISAALSAAFAVMVVLLDRRGSQRQSTE